MKDRFGSATVIFPAEKTAVKRILSGLMIALIFSLFFSGCRAKPDVLKPALENDGEIYLYIQPLPQEADRLRFTLQEITAIHEDGIHFPLSLSFSECVQGGFCDLLWNNAHPDFPF